MILVRMILFMIIGLLAIGCLSYVFANVYSIWTNLMKKSKKIVEETKASETNVSGDSEDAERKSTSAE